MQTKKVALLIGVSRYQDRAIPPLEFAANDAVQLARALVAAGWQVYLLVNLDALLSEDRDWVWQNSSRSGALQFLGDPTWQRVDQALRSVAALLDSGDVFLFHYSGHGFTDNGQHYLTLGDTVMDDLRTTALGVERLRQWAAHLRQPKIVFALDACRNSPSRTLQQRAQMSPALARDLAVLSQQSSSAILFACSEGELAYEDSKLRHGIFTYALIEAMRGATLNANGEVTVLDVAGFLAQRVPQLSGGKQRPYLQYSGSTNIVLATLAQIPRSPDARNPSCEVLLQFIPAVELFTQTVDWYVDGAYITQTRTQDVWLTNTGHELKVLVPPGKHKFTLSVRGGGYTTPAQRSARHSRSRGQIIIGSTKPVGAKYNVHLLAEVRANFKIEVRASVAVGNRLDVKVYVNGRPLKRNDRQKEPDLNNFCVEFL